MDSATWLNCADPEHLLAFLDSSPRNRKLRLWSCACCWRIAHLLSVSSRKAVKGAEDYADGLLGVEELQQVIRDARKGRRGEGRWGSLEYRRNSRASDAVFWVVQQED